MHIVIEGPDNSGKSTLAQLLSERLGIPLKHSGGPSKYRGEITERTRRFNADPATMIYDRYPAVSQNIYQTALNYFNEYVSDEAVAEFYAQKPLIIYCRNVRGAADHVRSNHKLASDDDFHGRIGRYFKELCDAYDLWACQHANLVYRIGDDTGRLIETVSAYIAAPGINTREASFDPWQDIIAFHEKFGITYGGKPRQLPEEFQAFRIRVLKEEPEEYEEHMVKANYELDVARDDEAEFLHHLEESADALVDNVYFALGNAYLHGFDFPEMWRRVHAANMMKVRAAVDGSDSKRKSSFDVVKPPGWEKPRHIDLVEDHAHRDVFDNAAQLAAK